MFRLSLKDFKLAAVIVPIFLLALGVYYTARANQSYIGPFARTATATTTMSFMTPGAATTTVTYDSYNVNTSNSTQSNIVMPDVPDSAVLAMQFNASSTATVYNVNIEYSQDNIDWYQNTLVAPSGTTSPTLSLQPANSFQFNFATSTQGGIAYQQGINGTSTLKMVSISVPTRYVRAIISLPLGSLNGAVWAAIYPKKQFPTK